jgi:hypothetical protein
MISGLPQRDFAKTIGKRREILRKWERGEMGFTPANAKKVMEKIQNLLNGKQISLEKVLNTFQKFKKSAFDFDFQKLIENGHKLAKNSKPTEMEKKIEEILTLNHIPFTIHASVNGIKKMVNVDFAIPSEKTPLIILETFSIRKQRRLNSNLRMRIAVVDHKFQAVKLCDEKVMTILHINFTGKPIIKEFERKRINTELLNTDILLLNEEIENLHSIVTKKLKTIST